MTEPAKPAATENGLLGDRSQVRDRDEHAAGACPDSRGAAWRMTVYAAVILSFTAAAFAPALDADFVDWDDTSLIVENPYIRGLGAQELYWMISSFHMGPYQPLPWLSLAVDYQIWGMDAFGFHLTNILWHGASVLSFFVLVRRLLRIGIGIAPHRVAVIDGCAAIAALVFGIHPLRVESVVWISERRDVMSGLFFIWTIYAYVMSCDPIRRWPRAWFGLSIGCFACSMLSKSTGVGLAAVLVIMDFYPLGRLRLSADGLFGVTARRVWIEKLPYVLLGAAAGMAAIYGQKTAGVMTSFEAYGPMHRLALVGYSFLFYIRKTVLPLDLSPLYEIPPRFSPWRTDFVVSGITSVAILAVAWCVRRRWPALLAVCLGYLVLLLPVSGVAHAGGHLAADRYSYLSCMGIAILAGGVVLALSARLQPARFDQIFTIAMLVPLSFVLSHLTRKQSAIWHDTLRLWRHAMTLNRNSSLVYNNVAKALLREGRLDETYRLLSRALELRPDNAEAHNNLAITLGRMGLPVDAMAHYREAERLRPNSIDIQRNIGLLLCEEPWLQDLGFSSIEEQWKEASSHFERALARRPDQPETLIALGVVTKKLGNSERAIALYRAALEMDPDHVDARFNLAIALSDRGDDTGAAAEYARILDGNSAHAGAWNNLALIAERRGDFSAAVDSLRNGLARVPTHRVLLFHLGWLRATAPDSTVRDGAAALSTAKRLLDAVGDDPAALDLMAAALAEMGDFDEATKAAVRAATLAEQRGNPDVARKVSERAEQYRLRKPFREAHP